MSNHANADEDASRKACESLATMSTQTFQVDTSEWVEQWRVPDRVIASGKAFPGKTPPLCPYPKVARFDGTNEDSQESFSCR